MPKERAGEPKVMMWNESVSKMVTRGVAGV